MLKKKSKTGSSPSLYTEREKKSERFANSIINGAFILSIVLWWLLNWKFALGCFVFALWSAFWYDQGKYDNVTDEYEAGGYPVDGLRLMIKSWIAFAVIAILAVVWYESCHS